MIKTVRPGKFDLYIAVEFPSASSRVLAGHAMRLWRTDVDPEEEIKSCEALALYVDAEGVVWGEALMWADENGCPILSGKPLINRSNQIVTKTFSVHITAALSKSSYNKGYEEGFAGLHGRPLTAAAKMRNRKMVEA